LCDDAKSQAFMTADEITGREVARVRKLTNMTEEQCSRKFIVVLLHTMFPTEAAQYILNISDPTFPF
jgi:hypothetical protein